MPPKKTKAPTTKKDAGEEALPPVKPKSLSGKTVIISGEIEDYDRKTAQKILEAAGATFAKSLNKSVNLVVLGGNAGPKKLEKIEEMGVETKEWDLLLKEIESGESGPGAVVEDEDEVQAEEEFEPEEMEEDVRTRLLILGLKANVPLSRKEPEPEPEPAPKAAAKGSKKETKPVANTSKSRKAGGKAAAAKKSGAFSLEGKSVLISGTVPGHNRKSASALLEKHGADVTGTLNKDVDLVVLGVNPGPDKTVKIEELGIDTLKWEELAEKLGLDYIGEDELDPPPEPTTLSAAPSSVAGKTLLITGAVEGHTRSSAQKLLEGSGAKFAKSLNKSVDLVVLGANPGPDKLAKINELEIPTAEWEDLVGKLGLDAEAGAPPKKKARKK